MRYYLHIALDLDLIDGSDMLANLHRLYPLSCLWILMIVITIVKLSRNTYDITKSSQDLDPSSGKTESKPDVYCTYLASRVSDPHAEDNYYNATRLVVFQLLHNPETKDNKQVVVMTLNQTSQWKLDQLKRDGAIIRVAETIDPPGQLSKQFQDQYTKLRLFTFTEYNRIFYIDADMLLTRSIKEIWDHPSVGNYSVVDQALYTLSDDDKKMEYAPDRDGELFVSDYTLAGTPDPYFDQDEHPYFNAGFFLTRPDINIFERLIQMMPHPNMYGGLAFAEQNLLNYAFRRRGPTPWRLMPKNLGTGIVTTSGGPVDRGVGAIHTKFWWTHADFKLRRLGQQLYGKMEGFYGVRYKDKDL